MSSTPNGLLSLPNEILDLLPKFLQNIEDFNNLRSTCRVLRDCMDTASPRMILQLAAAQKNVFFRPSPHFLVAATARQLGDWVRQSDENEAQFCSSVRGGMRGLFWLSLRHCGLTLERIRELHLTRFSTINPVTNIIDQCCGVQWYDVPDFWNGGRSDANTISSDPSVTFFHLSMYGDLFGPDLEAYLDGDTSKRTLQVQTRLEYVKYCLDDFYTWCYNHPRTRGENDPRRTVEPVGPYKLSNGGSPDLRYNHNIALLWTIRSSRWLPHWKAIRQLAGPDWEEYGHDNPYGTDDDSDDDDGSWRQHLWQGVIICQGLEGLKMISPCLTSVERESWVAQIKVWREKIAKLPREAERVMIVRKKTHGWPDLYGDLKVCGSY